MKRIRNKKGQFQKIHGAKGTRTYNIWKQMRQRCDNPNNCSYSRYGKRGISYDKSWDSFANFLLDMGNAPIGMSLERLDNTKGYSKENCGWTDNVKQANNRRSNRTITFNGITMTLAQWSRKVGLKSYTLRARIVKGWDIKDALFKPITK